MNPGSGSPIGHVTETSGTVMAIGTDGSQRILEVGDAVYLNEQIVTQAGASVLIQLMNNRIVSASEGNPLMLNDALTQAPVIELESTEISSAEKAPDTEQQIENGVDPTEVTEPPSAGNSSDTTEQPEPESQSSMPGMPVVEREEYSDDASASATSASTGSPSLADVPEDDHELTQPLTLNYIPVAQFSSMTATEDSTNLAGQLQATDANTGEMLSFHLMQAPELGVLNLNEDGSFEFLPGNDFQYLGAGEDTSVTFTFEVRDSLGNYSQATVDIAIAGVNDTPESSAPIASTADQNSDSFSVNLLENSNDVDVNDSLSVSRMRLVSGNEAGVSISLDGNALVIDPQMYNYLAEGEQEVISYEYRVVDSQGAYSIQTAEIILDGQNDVPTVSNAVVYSGDQDVSSLSINLLDGVSDIDATDTLNVVSLQLVAGDPQGITVSPDGNSLELDSSAYAALAEGETEEIEYQYTVDDGHGGQVEQTASVTIEGVNDAPVSGNSQSVTDEDTPYIFSLNDFPYSDVDNGDQLEYVQVSELPVEGTLLLNNAVIVAGQDINRADIEAGLLQFQPESNASGDSYSSFLFRVSDGDLLSEEHQFTVDVTPVADAPELTIDGSELVTELGFENGLGDWSSENGHEIHSSGGPIGDSHSGSKLAELDVG